MVLSQDEMFRLAQVRRKDAQPELAAARANYRDARKRVADEMLPTNGTTSPDEALKVFEQAIHRLMRASAAAMS